MTIRNLLSRIWNKIFPSPPGPNAFTKPSEEQLLNLDYLIFSSHKTATQTVRHTLGRKYQCTHCHSLNNIGINAGQFLPYLEDYQKRNQRKLRVLSVFRDHLPRYISSFFQFYGTKPLDRNEVVDETETIIYRYSTEQLIEKFIQELEEVPLYRSRESIDEICRELQISVQDLSYNPEKKIGVYENELIKLYILRFDVLIKNMKTILKEITGSRVKIKNTNIAASKWYRVQGI